MQIQLLLSKQMLANATLLVHTNPSAPLKVTFDAGDFAIRGVLQRVLITFSKNIVKNWSILQNSQQISDT